MLRKMETSANEKAKRKARLEALGSSVDQLVSRLKRKEAEKEKAASAAPAERKTGIADLSAEATFAEIKPVLHWTP